MVRTPLAFILGSVAHVVGLTLDGAMRHLLTERMMTLAIPPGAPIHLGRNLDGDYPAPLREPRNDQLLALLTRFQPTDGVAADVAAYDWSVLEQRMRLITRLFRLRHQDTQLFEGPYSAAQLTALEAGHLPEGTL